MSSTKSPIPKPDEKFDYSVFTKLFEPKIEIETRQENNQMSSMTSDYQKFVRNKMMKRKLHN
jgi:hypothetical protein